MSEPEPGPEPGPDEAAGIVLETELSGIERLVFFSDAVVAIAITLLALVLPLPRGSTNHAVLSSLWDHNQDYLAFLISFAVIGSHWFSHRRIFRYVGRGTAWLQGLNMAWLLM